jgi:hypothetical protein
MDTYLHDIQFWLGRFHHDTFWGKRVLIPRISMRWSANIWGQVRLYCLLCDYALSSSQRRRNAPHKHLADTQFDKGACDQTEARLRLTPLPVGSRRGSDLHRHRNAAQDLFGYLLRTSNCEQMAAVDNLDHCHRQYNLICRQLLLLPVQMRR